MTRPLIVTLQIAFTVAIEILNSYSTESVAARFMAFWGIYCVKPDSVVLVRACSVRLCLPPPVGTRSALFLYVQISCHANLLSPHQPVCTQGVCVCLISSEPCVLLCRPMSEAIAAQVIMR